MFIKILTLMSILLTSIIVHAATHEYQISKQYTKKNGLQVNAVTDLAIDKAGFLWVATHDGLLRFDGSQFKLYNTNSHPNMPRDRVIKIEALDNGGLIVIFDLNQASVLEDNIFTNLGVTLPFARHLHGNELWFGNDKGVFKRDLKEKITEQIFAVKNLQSLAVNEQGIYYTDSNCALHLYSTLKKVSTIIKKLNCKAAFGMSLSAQGVLAIGTDNGVFVFSKEIQHHLQGVHTYKVAWHKGVVYSVGNRLNHNNKLSRINKDNTIAYISEHYQFNLIEDLPIQTSVVGDVWLNTSDQLLKNDVLVFNSPSAIHKYVIDKDGGLWVGTRSDGLFYINKPQLHNYGLKKNEMESGNVSSISISHTGELLVGEETGLYAFNPKTESWNKFKNIHKAIVFLEDSQSNLWVGYKGLCLISDDSNCELQPNIVNRFSDLHLAYEQDNGNLWISSYKGLFVKQNNNWQKIPNADAKYNFATEISQHGVFISSTDQGITIFQNNTIVGQINTKKGLPTNRIRAIYDANYIIEDSILIGTEDKGLCLWHLDKGLIRCASINEGLIHHGVHRILPDQKERLWFSSNKGIYTIHIKGLIQFFNFETDFLPNYLFDEKDGMIDSEANGGTQSSGVVDAAGVMWFPTQKGIVKVDTNSIKTKQEPLIAYIDEIYVDNKLQKNHHIVVLNNPNNRNLIIKLHTIALGYSDGIYFRYRLDRSAQWTELHDSNRINFESLSAGQHNLEFQAARHGDWSGPVTTLKVQVKPALMETVWFRILITAVVILSLLYWIANLKKNKFKLEKQVGKRTHELRTAMEVISEQKDTIKEEARRKQQHFLDLSHELRTPLTLVLTPLHTDAPIANETRSLMKRNADRLLSLVNQMLRLEQLDLFDDDLNHSEVSLSNRCMLVFEQFKLVAKKRNIQLTSKLPQIEVYIIGSEPEIDTLLINLISNAIKFTPDHGSIHISLIEKSHNQCIISIEDSGPGIAVDEREQIFKRFVRLNQETVEGNGLGLSIVKRITKRHKGEIHVNDSDLGGANFEVTLPVYLYTETINHTEIVPNSSRVVLAIDDNADILLLIKSILSPHYQVVCSQEPIEGLKIAKRQIPDLIMVDVGMPDLNGFDLVVQLREHPDTKNIPVIFATARSHPKDQVTAIESGGDVFLTKPFMPEQLISYVNRLMKTKNVSTTAEDEITKETSLLTRAKKIINNVIGNPEFGTDELAQELAMSRSVMYRNFREDADILPAEFIKRCRLEHASELLKNTQLSASKIANLSGYNQVSSFSRSFKKHFGHSPKEHR